MRLFNLDAHISVIADVENIFKHLYPEIEVTKWSISGHTWVFDQAIDHVDVINQETWKFLDHDMIKRFHERYDGFLALFDGFICGFPPVFALLFEKYNKPIFMVNATRYEMPFCWEPNPAMQGFFEERLQAMHKKGQLIAVSNNKADVDYLERAIALKSRHIPSMCRYTGESYQPAKETFLLFSKAKLNPIEGVVYYKDLGHYSWADLYSFKGIIHLPYEISTMSIFEHYSASVPLLMPTKRLLKQFLQNQRIPFNGPYARGAHHGVNRPDLDDILGEEWFDFWLDRADFYDQENMPYITYYDHIGEIPTLLKSMDTKAIHLQMKAFNRKRFASALDDWKSLLEPHYCKPHADQVQGNGQINMRSKFGAIIHRIARVREFNTFFEIGTWNGEGSTVCIMNALMKRADASKLYSLELMPEMYAKAQQFWSWLEVSEYAHQLILLNGKIIDEGILSAQEVQDHPAFPKVQKHYDLYYQSDVSYFEKAENVSDQLPEQIDVVLLDGGEFCTFAEFEYVMATLDPKVLILDDTNIIKSAQARSCLLKDHQWSCYYDDLSDRHGAAIFVRKDCEQLMPLLN